MTYEEINIDSLVGPSHHYGGYAKGNIASIKSKNSLSNPKLAAIQGLDKMLLLHQKGYTQLILPPHPRPYLPLARKLGYSGEVEDLIKQLIQEDPKLLMQLYSSSGMWMANSATISPSLDTQDAKMHLTFSNLATHLHRSIEAPFNQQIFSKVFPSEKLFSKHPSLPYSSFFADEGAANTLRLCSSFQNTGVEIFCYGYRGYEIDKKYQYKNPPRQSYSSCYYLAKTHRVKHALFAQQNINSIQKGVFHNDVIALSHERLLFFHEKAFEYPEAFLSDLEKLNKGILEESLCLLPVDEHTLSVEKAVKSYLFNSQLLSLKNGNMFLLCPKECQQDLEVFNYLQNLKQASNPIEEIEFVDLRQSMKNGGGPACLRLRVLLSDEEKQHIPSSFFFSEKKYQMIKEFVEKEYPDTFSIENILDPFWAKHCIDLLKKLQKLWNSDSLYSENQLQ